MKNFPSIVLFAAGGLLVGLALYGVFESYQAGGEDVPFLRLFMMALLAGFCFQAGAYFRNQK